MSEGLFHLLIVDDEADFRRVLADHFEDLGYRITQAGDGQEALERFESDARKADLVLTDIRMPRLGGEELIAELRRRRPYLPIIGVTGHADLKGKLSLLDRGAYYFLDKPLPQWPIVDRLIENAIRLHRHEEQLHAARAKEREIARLLRTYASRRSVHRPGWPRSGPASAIDLEIELEMVETDSPGGDYVEWFRRSPDEVLFYVADASGHDDLLSSFMTCLASMVLHRSHHGEPPTVDRLITALDHALAELREAGALGPERFLTFFIGLVDLRTGELSYVNAGHPDALLLSQDRDGHWEQRALASNCRPVGFLFDYVPAADRVTLVPGDLLFLYTDGASELLEEGAATDVGIARLAQAVLPLAGEPVAKVVEGVSAYLHAKLGGRGFPDDTTLMAIRVHEKGQLPE